jgi:predicted transcriptional regulator
MLGELESQVMEIVWARGTVTVRDVHEAITRMRPLAYTTIMTVMTRLAEKGVLRRELVDGAYLYRPAEARAEFEARAATRLLKDALDAYGEATITSFVDLLAEQDPDQIAQLDRLLKAKRRELAGQRKGR